MFEHEHHRRIVHVLDCLDREIFDEVGARFGGGTLITLLHGEYRWSRDIDFICPVGPRYRRLRQIVFEGAGKPAVLFARTDSLEFPRDLLANQYGIRFAVAAAGTLIKFEIVAEARIELEPPETKDWLNVPCLSRIDRYAEKLLANADRGVDSSTRARDLIDLAVLRLHGEQSQRALDKAEAAYPVLAPLRKSLETFQASKDFRAQCFSALEIRNRPRIMDGIDLLAEDLGLTRTDRAPDERCDDA